ncbi:amino acid transporter [Hyphopichia burtonii NRRL Y-1933]|uniref:Amino acid transporter n=1 Tax=Hyphopichia burtonii NRRL Y-1933 TaxID=984485 RepID=A0A1E4RPI1_9ASCO|nr:amino acid transporter [Hyphopichia burtonii NRRL Y-1933]ODV69121.1 amino acid transporter [Hyphopichia burtonii NRRL Y-1933]
MPTLIPASPEASLTHRHHQHHDSPSHTKPKRTAKLGTLSCISLITNKMLGTGLFSTPSLIFRLTNGNVPLYFSLWIVGAIVVFSGLIIYLEFALNLPFKNGGEKNYLLKVFKNPKGLAGCVYAFQMVLLGFSSGNSFAFGKYTYFALTGNQDLDNESYSKLIGVGCISFCIWLHIKFPNQGTSLFNFLGIVKILILVLIILLGALVGVGLISINDSDLSITPSLKNENGMYSISVALLEIIYSFKGWENANYVLSEIDDPYHVLTIAAPLAVGIVTILYFLVIISYLVVIPKAELLDSGVLVAGIFFNKIFGEGLTSQLLPFLIALSTLGNVMVVSFAHSYVNQELLKSNYIPFSKYFQNINHSLLLHWAITILVMVVPPLAEIYEFVVNLYIYPGTWINLFITIGLIYLRLNRKREQWGKYNAKFNLGSLTGTDTEQLDSIYPLNDDESVYTEFDSLISSENPVEGKIISAPYICIFIFLIANLFLALFPFVPPVSPSKLSIPYWLFPVVGTSVLLFGGFFFYTRKWLNSFTYEKWNIGEPDIKYEEDHLE